MNPQLEKILATIPNLQGSRFILKRYRVSHSSLTIEISNSDGSSQLYLDFEGVAHIQCPTSWQGTTIFMGSKEECIEILHKLNKGFEEMLAENLDEMYHLFKFQHPHLQIHVLARSIYLIDKLPI